MPTSRPVQRDVDGARLSPVAALGRKATLVALALVTATVSACGGSRGSGERTASSPTFAVGSRTETFVDRSRETEARGEVPGQPTRTLETFVYYPAEGKAGGDPTPDAAPLTAKGPFPLVIFSHGSGVASPLRYDLLFRSWAAAGYVIAAPKHPLSSTSLPGGSSDVVNQPGDVSFLITELLRLSDDPASRYGRLLDGSRIGVAGHSLGAGSALGVGFNRCCVDPRIRAGVVLAGRVATFPEDGWFAGITTPILVVHGDDDRLVRLAEGQKIFAGAAPPKAMLTIFGGDHNRPYGGSLATEDNPERLGATSQGPTGLVNTTVIGFLDRYLKGRVEALTQLRTALAEEVSVKFDVVE